LDCINDFGEIKTASGSLKKSATFTVPMTNNIRVKRKWFSGVEASVTSGDTEDMTNTIEIPETNDKLSDNGVESRAETTACDDCNFNIGRVEVDGVTWTGASVGEACGVRENDVVMCDVEALVLGGVEVRV
jgi:hypothetical protein